MKFEEAKGFLDESQKEILMEIGWNFLQHRKSIKEDIRGTAE